MTSKWLYCCGQDMLNVVGYEGLFCCLKCERVFSIRQVGWLDQPTEVYRAKRK